MLKLYVKTHCPYCAKVLLALTGLIHDSGDSRSYQVLYVDRDPEALMALTQTGGKEMVPFLADARNGVQMYESADIVSHLRANYAR